MNIKEIFDRIEANLPQLNFASTYAGSSNSDLTYTAKNLVPLKDAVSNLDGIDFIQSQITDLKSTRLFRNYNDEDAFNSNDNTKIGSLVQELRVGLQFLLNYYNASFKNEQNSIDVKLPEIRSFDDLTRACNDLKKAIEYPINDSNSAGNVQILAAENGSIWLIVSVGTPAALNLVASICWAGAVIRKKKR